MPYTGILDSHGGEAKVGVARHESRFPLKTNASPSRAGKVIPREQKGNTQLTQICLSLFSGPTEEGQSRSRVLRSCRLYLTICSSSVMLGMMTLAPERRPFSRPRSRPGTGFHNSKIINKFVDNFCKFRRAQPCQGRSCGLNAYWEVACLGSEAYRSNAPLHQLPAHKRGDHYVWESLYLYDFFQPFGRRLRLMDETAPEVGKS